MEKETANINVKLGLTINGMPIAEFQKELEKLSHLLDEMKQLSMFRDNGARLDNMPGVGTAEIHGAPYWTIRNVELSIGKDEGTD